MKSIYRRNLKTAALLFAAAFAAILFSGRSEGLSIGIIGRRDAVVMSGKQLPAMTGMEISSLNMVAYADGRRRSIPLQVDEVRDGNHTYEWVNKLGTKNNLFTSDTDGGKLDDDDELAFMAWDLGEKTPPESLPKAEKIVEIAVTDPLTGKTGFAYLLAGSSLPESEKRYINLEVSPPRYLIHALGYEYSSPIELGYFDLLRPRSFSSALLPNLVLRNRTPGTGALRIGPKMDFDFYDLIRGDVIARKEGPVRVFWRVAGGADFGILRINAKGSAEQTFYPERMDLPVAMELPFSFDSILKSFVVAVTLKLDPKSLPAMFYSPSNRQGIRIDGTKKADVVSGTGAQESWFALSSNGVTLYFVAIFPEEWQKGLKLAPVVRDGPDGSEVGLDFGDIVHLFSKGKHEYMIRYYLVPEPYKPGDEKAIPEISGKQLTVRALELKVK